MPVRFGRRTRKLVEHAVRDEVPLERVPELVDPVPADDRRTNAEAGEAGRDVSRRAAELTPELARDELPAATVRVAGVAARLEAEKVPENLAEADDVQERPVARCPPRPREAREGAIVCREVRATLIEVRCDTKDAQRSKPACAAIAASTTARSSSASVAVMRGPSCRTARGRDCLGAQIGAHGDASSAAGGANEPPARRIDARGPSRRAFLAALDAPLEIERVPDVGQEPKPRLGERHPRAPAAPAAPAARRARREARRASPTLSGSRVRGGQTWRTHRRAVPAASIPSRLATIPVRTLRIRASRSVASSPPRSSIRASRVWNGSSAPPTRLSTCAPREPSHRASPRPR